MIMKTIIILVVVGLIGLGWSLLVIAKRSDERSEEILKGRRKETNHEYDERT